MVQVRRFSSAAGGGSVKVHDHKDLRVLPFTHGVPSDFTKNAFSKWGTANTKIFYLHLVCILGNFSEAERFLRIMKNKYFFSEMFVQQPETDRNRLKLHTFFNTFNCI